jgi:hypothetical protein
MKIQFIIQTLGYLVAEFEIEDRKIKIGHSSTYGDKFQELLNELFFIYKITKEEDIDFFPYTCEVMWYDDRVNYLWVVTSKELNSEIGIEVFELSPSDTSYKVELVNKNIKHDDLFDAIFFSLDEILQRFGFIGYKTNWDIGNFPIFEYLMLKADKYNFKLPLQHAVEDDEWMNKVPIKNELDLILLGKSDGY